jgi:integrase
MGTIYQRKVKVCLVCEGRRIKECETASHDIEVRVLPIWWIRYSRDGRSYFESSGSKQRTDAKKLLQSREGDGVKGVPITPRMGKVRFDEAADDLKNEYKVNKRKSEAELKRRIDKHLAPFFQGRRLSSISTSDVRAYIATRQADVIVVRTKPELVTKGVSNAEINRELSALKRLFTLAVQAGKILHRPHIPMLREDNVRKGFFERQDYLNIGKHLGPSVRGVITFAYITGWRVQSEVLPLEWRHVDWPGRVVRLDAGTTKNREGRTFPFTAELEALLKEQLSEHERLKKESEKIVPWVFNRAGERIVTFRKEWTDARRAAGLPGKILHDLRRTAVRNLVRAGIPERVAMQMTGHKTRSVFERYNIVSEGDLTDAARRLDSAAARMSSVI